MTQPFFCCCCFVVLLCSHSGDIWKETHKYGWMDVFIDPRGEINLPPEQLHNNTKQVNTQLHIRALNEPHDTFNSSDH